MSDTIAASNDGIYPLPGVVGCPECEQPTVASDVAAGTFPSVTYVCRTAGCGKSQFVVTAVL